MDTHFDLIAVGGGSIDTANIVNWPRRPQTVPVSGALWLGGTCVNVGCVPKKIMWFAANVAQDARHAAEMGIKASLDGVDWRALVEGREGVIAGILDYWNGYVAGEGITHIQGDARFVDARTVEVDGTRYTADHIVIATGGRPIVPPVPGAELGITSDGFFALTEQPRRICVIGGGYIGMEMAEALIHRGLAVTVVEAMPSVIAGADRLTGERAGGAQHAGVVGGRVAIDADGIEGVGDGLLQQLQEQVARHGGVGGEEGEHGRHVRADHACALGHAQDARRAPAARMETNRPDIYAAGDCVETWHRVTGTHADDERERHTH